MSACAAFLPALHAWDLQLCAVLIYAACLRPGPCDCPCGGMASCAASISEQGCLARPHACHQGEADNQAAEPPQVLSSYPTTIRRRVLRHLYLQRVTSRPSGAQYWCPDPIRVTSLHRFPY